MGHSDLHEAKKADWTPQESSLGSPSPLRGIEHVWSQSVEDDPREDIANSSCRNRFIAQSSGRSFIDDCVADGSVRHRSNEIPYLWSGAFRQVVLT